MPNKFKQSEKFVEMFKEIWVTKSTVYFKAKQVKVLGKYPKLKKSSLLLNFLKDYTKTIKELCKESGEFESSV